MAPQGRLEMVVNGAQDAWCLFSSCQFYRREDYSGAENRRGVHRTAED